MKLPPEQEAIRAKCFHPSGTFVEFPKEDVETSIPARFEKIVREHPNRIAVKMGDLIVHYDELNMMANRVAGKLLRDFSTHSGPVGILLDNGPDLFATIMGVLKSGRFFIILDAAFPKTKIASILHNSRPQLLVHGKRYTSLAHEIAKDCYALEVESLTGSDGVDHIELPIAPDDLSTIFYTSG